MCKTLRALFCFVLVLYALVLGWLVSETARISAAVPPAPLPPFECCAPWVRGSAAVPVNAREFDRFESSDGSALSLRLVPSDGKTPALLFAVSSPDAASISVTSASVGARSALGSFVGHGVEVGADGEPVALWCAYEVAPPLRDGSALSLSVTSVYPDGSRAVFTRFGGVSRAV